MTRSVAWELVRSGHLVRSVRLAPFAPGAAAVVVLLVTRHGGTPNAVGDLRVLGLLLALGGGYALDDDAAVTLEASPYGPARRLWLRIGCATAVVAPLWTVMLGYLVERWTLGLGLTVELAAALAVVWAVAVWARRRGLDRPGVVTGPALLAALLLVASVPRAPMLTGRGPQWTAAHLRWSGVLAVAVCVLAAGTRDRFSGRCGRTHARPRRTGPGPPVRRNGRRGRTRPSG